MVRCSTSTTTSSGRSTRCPQEATHGCGKCDACCRCPRCGYRGCELYTTCRRCRRCQEHCRCDEAEALEDPVRPESRGAPPSSKGGDVVLLRPQACGCAGRERTRGFPGGYDCHCEAVTVKEGAAELESFFSGPAGDLVYEADSDSSDEEIPIAYCGQDLVCSVHRDEHVVVVGDRRSLALEQLQAGDKRARIPWDCTDLSFCRGLVVAGMAAAVGFEIRTSGLVMLVEGCATDVWSVGDLFVRPWAAYGRSERYAEASTAAHIVEGFLRLVDRGAVDLFDRGNDHACYVDFDLPLPAVSSSTVLEGLRRRSIFDGAWRSRSERLLGKEEFFLPIRELYVPPWWPDEAVCGGILAAPTFTDGTSTRQMSNKLPHDEWATLVLEKDGVRVFAFWTDLRRADVSGVYVDASVFRDSDRLAIGGVYLVGSDMRSALLSREGVSDLAQIGECHYFEAADREMTSFPRAAESLRVARVLTNKRMAGLLSLQKMALVSGARLARTLSNSPLQWPGFPNDGCWFRAVRKVTVGATSGIGKQLTSDLIDAQVVASDGRGRAYHVASGRHLAFSGNDVRKSSPGEATMFADMPESIGGFDVHACLRAVIPTGPPDVAFVGVAFAEPRRQLCDVNAAL